MAIEMAIIHGHEDAFKNIFLVHNYWKILFITVSDTYTKAEKEL